LFEAEGVLSGRVHSVFQKAVNLLAFTKQGERLFTLMMSDVHPCGLVCPKLQDVYACFCANMRFHSDTERFILFHCGPLLSIRGAKVWKQPYLRGRVSKDILAKHNATLYRFLFDEYHRKKIWKSRGKSLFFEEFAVEKINDVAERLSGKILTGEKLVELLRPLIGLGPGLTPLGDDFISGFLTTICLLESNPEIRVEIHNAGMNLAGGNTTFYSKHQIAFACEGICLRSIFLLIQGLVSLSFDIDLADQVMNIGATSGFGWLSGISAAASLVCRDTFWE
jgi:hypothetical protein